MLKVTDLKIAPESLGEQFILVEVAPVYKFTEDRKKTDEVIAYKYTCALPDLAFEKVNIKIDGDVNAIDMKDKKSMPVTFEGLQVKLFQNFTTKEFGISATAESVYKA